MEFPDYSEERSYISSHYTHTYWVKIVLWELFAANIEGFESICAVGAMFKKTLLGIGQVLHGFAFAEAVASALRSGGLNGEDEVCYWAWSVASLDILGERVAVGTLTSLKVRCRIRVGIIILLIRNLRI